MIKKILPRSQFTKNVLTLMTGTVIAQAIPIIITPVLTRIFSPEQFGEFGTYMAICSIIAIVVTGRYELAIIIPKEDKQAINILALSIGLSIVISLFLLIIVSFFISELSLLLGYKSNALWLYFVPLTTLIIGCFESLNYWNNRNLEYKLMASSRVLQTSTTGLTQLVLGGIIRLGTAGLVTGQILGQLISALFLAINIMRKNRKLIGEVSFLEIFKAAGRFKNFPKFLIISHGFNVSSSQSPIILLNSLFINSISGLYLLTNRVLSAPISLIAKSIGDVFRQQASMDYAKNGQCTVIYIKTLKKLTVLSILPFSILFIFSEFIFTVAFGEEWSQAGIIAKILTPTFFLRFISTPLSSMFSIAEAQNYDLYWQVILFILVVTSFIIGSYFDSYRVALILFSASYCLMYIINIYLSFSLSKGKLV